MKDSFLKLKKIKPVYDMIYKLMMSFCKILLIGDILITAWSILGRYIPFIKSPSWGEETVLTMMVYMAVLSATLAIRNRAHIRMTAFDKYMSKKNLLISDMISDIAVFLLGVFLFAYGMKICISPLVTLGRYASIPGLSKFWQYFSVPVAGAGMAFFELEQVYMRIVELISMNEKQKESEKKSEERKIELAG
ncbi:TRAP transporter small permease [Lachnospiraceae bacterium C1.1]|nr:TRAP transporter small permease [Lachnospiraceae bacterium C1.1]